MTDIVDSATRSRMMASIRGKNTKPELKVRRGLHQLGFRFRLHPRDLPGRPDLTFPKYRTAVFVHGCFWHRHKSCRLAYTPSANRQTWIQKFEGNVERDRRQIAQLHENGWRVFVVWECVLRRSDLSEVLLHIADELKTGTKNFKEWPSPEEMAEGRDLPGSDT